MFWNKSNIIFIICSYFSIYGHIETLTQDEKDKLCDVPNTAIPHPHDKRVFIFCDDASKGVIRECPANECFTDGVCRPNSCPKELSASELFNLCKGQTAIQSVPYTNNQNKYILCTPNDQIPLECPIEQCFDKSNFPCTENACVADDFTGDAVKKYCNSNANTVLQTVPDKNCENYYLCLGPTDDPLHLTCPSNQHYSRVEAKCTSPIEAGCSHYTLWCQNKLNGVKFAAPKCYDYYECSSEKTIPKSCSYNQYFDQTRGECVNGVCQDNYGNDVIRKPTCTANNEGVYMAHPKCYKFYVCLNGNAFQGQCSSGYFFDSTQENCVRDIYNECKDD